MSEIPQETIDWLKEQHAMDVERFKYALCEGSAWYYTKEYLTRTPLPEIKANCDYKGKEKGKEVIL